MLFDPEVAEVFRSVCAASAEERERRLAMVAPAIRERVEQLLALDAQADGLFGTESGTIWLSSPGGAEDVPESVGGFQIIQRIGAGGMGVVYEAEQQHPRRRVAIKLIRPTVRSEDAIERFRFEAQALASVNHPGVPAIYEAGETPDGIVYLAMELVRGPTLREWAGLRHAEPAERVQLIIDLADAVQAAHDAGVLHRDLKPANIVVTPTGPVVLDFGIAAPLAEPGEGRQPGTPAYMSPEALAGEVVDARSDVYALGIIAHELLSREPLNRAEPTCPAPSLPLDVGRSISRALSPDVASRTPSAAALKEDLEDALAWRALDWGGGTAYRIRRAARRHRTGLVVAGVSAAAVLTALIGPKAYQWQTDRARVELASQRLEQLRASIVAAGPADAERIEEMVARFVEDPAHRSTPAESQAWSALADRLATIGVGRERHALAAAFVAADNPSEPRRHLARYFDRECDYNALWRLRSNLTPSDREQLQPELVRAAVATRHLTEPFVVPARPALEALTRARSLDIVGDKGALLEIPGLTAPAVFAINRRLDLYDIGSTEPFWSSELPEEGIWATRDNVTVHEGALYLAWGTPTDAGLYRLRADTPGGLEPIGKMRPSKVQRVVSARGPDGMLLLAARSYPARTLSVLDPQTGAATPLVEGLHELDSDVMDVLPYDFDGDGVDELVVSIGAWEAYDLRVLGHRGTGWQTLARLRTGTIGAVDIVHDAEGRPLIIGGKSDEEANLRLFPKSAPYGPPAGVYAWRFEGTQLTQVAHWPVPVTDRDGPGVIVQTPTVGDFDGDGTDDVAWTLKEVRDDIEELLWVQWDVAGDSTSDVLVGLEVLQAMDVDGDGDDELLVGDENKDLWLLGTGEQTLPPWEPEATAQDVPQDLPSGDAWVTRMYSRAMELSRVGLLEEAALALQNLAVMVGDEPTQRHAELAAARLLEASGKVERATQSYEIALSIGAEEARPDLVRAYLHTLDLPSAVARHRGEPAWLDSLPSTEPTDLLADAMHGWHLERPGTLRDTSPDLTVDVFNDEGVIARMPVDIVSPWVQLDLEVLVQTLELGSGLALELVQDGQTRLGVAVWGQGGGGVTQLYPQCGHDLWEHFEREPMPDPTQAVTLRAARVGPVGSTRCSTSIHGETHYVDVPTSGLERGPAELVLRAFGDASYAPPTRARLVLERMQSLGLELRDVPANEHERAVRQLFDGRLPNSVPASVRPEWAIARGDVSELATAVRALPVHEQRWLLRRYGAITEPVLREVLGEDFAEVYADTYAEAARDLTRPEVQEALLRPPLAVIDTEDSKTRMLRVRRAQAHFIRGERGAARSVAMSVVNANTYDPPTRDAMLLLARLSCDEPAVAREWVERAAAADAAPESVWDRTHIFPELAALDFSPDPSAAP